MNLQKNSLGTFNAYDEEKHICFGDKAGDYCSEQ